MQPLWKTVWTFLKKLKMELPFHPAIPPLGLYLKNPEAPVQKNPCTPLFVTALFIIVKCWKQPKCPSVNESVKKLWFIYIMEYYIAERKKELLPFTTAWIELESITLSEISQAVKDKYHMISPLTGTNSTEQTSKQNTTRYIEIKNKLTVTRGEAGGDNRRKKGKACSGTCIKDPWTKTTGWRAGLNVGGRVWVGQGKIMGGGNGDNCN